MATKSFETVMVTGANGFIASYIVKALLAKGYRVHACVREASQESKVNHLLTFPQAKENLKLFSTGDLVNSKRDRAFDGPMEGCDAVIHAATPLRHGKDGDPKDMIYQPAMISTQELLDCIDRHDMHRLVLTSSMAAIAPVPEPAIKNEAHWSDSEGQKSRGSWYGATKTDQEQLVQNWVKSKRISGTKGFHYAAICPTTVLGPSLSTQQSVGGTMGRLKGWCLDSRSSPVPNGSMSLVHVEDCAKLHVAALETPQASGRYMCLVESWHWNELLQGIQKHYPQLPGFTPCENPVRPTEFDLMKRDSLGVAFRSMDTILQESIDYLKALGEL